MNSGIRTAYDLDWGYCGKSSSINLTKRIINKVINRSDDKKFSIKNMVVNHISGAIDVEAFVIESDNTTVHIYLRSKHNPFYKKCLRNMKKEINLKKLSPSLDSVVYLHRDGELDKKKSIGLTSFMMFDSRDILKCENADEVKHTENKIIKNRYRIKIETTGSELTEGDIINKDSELMNLIKELVTDHKVVSKFNMEHGLRKIEENIRGGLCNTSLVTMVINKKLIQLFIEEEKGGFYIDMNKMFIYKRENDFTNGTLLSMLDVRNEYKESCILNGKLKADRIKDGLEKDIEVLTKKIGRKPGLGIIQVGREKASDIYVNKKVSTGTKIGINCELIEIDKDCSNQDIVSKIDYLNKADHIDGIIVQLPLPDGIDTKMIIDSISHIKDVDGFHPRNVGNLAMGESFNNPCTPLGIMKLLSMYDIKLEGMNVTIVGRSNLVGKPLSTMMTNVGATVTLCHSKTKDLKEHTLKADLVVMAVGIPKLLKADMIKKGSIIIDVGINRDENNKLCGDVDFEDVKDKAFLTTPVPGGVGPMTVISLMGNVLRAFKKREAFRGGFIAK